MKQTIIMILATFVLLWSVNATAFDFGSTAAKNIQYTFPVYPDAYRKNKEQCEVFFTHDSVKKVAQYYSTALNKHIIVNKDKKNGSSSFEIDMVDDKEINRDYMLIRVTDDITFEHDVEGIFVGYYSKHQRPQHDPNSKSSFAYLTKHCDFKKQKNSEGKLVPSFRVIWDKKYKSQLSTITPDDYYDAAQNMSQEEAMQMMQGRGDMAKMMQMAEMHRKYAEATKAQSEINPWPIWAAYEKDVQKVAICSYTKISFRALIAEGSFYGTTKQAEDKVTVQYERHPDCKTTQKRGIPKHG